MISEILNKQDFTKEDIIQMLSVDTNSDDFYRLLAKSNAMSRAAFHNKGYIFAQIGINAEGCSGNCKFCSMARDHFLLPHVVELTDEEIVAQAKQVPDKVQALFLMTTADYDKERYLSVGKKVRAVLPENMDLVANIGDFDLEYARRLKEAGFSAVYHIVRLREGIDTDLDPQVRIQTIEALLEAGLNLYYCVEPIGKEHSYEEIADEILRAKKYHVDVMAVMRRVNVPGTGYPADSEISAAELTKIAAVARIVVDPKISMNVHEPLAMAMLGGVNQLYAEIGVNPRDTESHTENQRGYSVGAVEKMLNEGGYYLSV
ncbi:MAG: radical SAM protein [Massiliimalia sp.]|jgi:biotin synthase